jgi:hypothetical protein
MQPAPFEGYRYLSVDSTYDGSLKHFAVVLVVAVSRSAVGSGVDSLATL